jgi:hypothetical protein
MSRSADAAESKRKLTSAPEAGRQIVEAIRNGTVRVRIGNDAKMLDRLSRLAPTRAIMVIANKMKDVGT